MGIVEELHQLLALQQGYEVVPSRRGGSARRGACRCPRRCRRSGRSARRSQPRQGAPWDWREANFASQRAQVRPKRESDDSQFAGLHIGPAIRERGRVGERLDPGVQSRNRRTARRCPSPEWCLCSESSRGSARRTLRRPGWWRRCGIAVPNPWIIRSTRRSRKPPGPPDTCRALWGWKPPPRSTSYRWERSREWTWRCLCE